MCCDPISKGVRARLGLLLGDLLTCSLVVWLRVVVGGTRRNCFRSLSLSLLFSWVGVEFIVLMKGGSEGYTTTRRGESDSKAHLAFPNTLP